MTISKKEKDRRKTARKLLTEFLISINNNQELVIQDRYAVLRSRNPKNYPVLEDLMGLSENETNEFLKLVGVVRGSEAYTMVHEPILNEIAMDCKIDIGSIYFKLKTRQAPAFFILFGTHPKAHCPNNSEEQKFSKNIFLSQARKLLAEATHDKRNPKSPAPKHLNNTSKCRKATTPLADSPQEVRKQYYKRPNQSKTPGTLKSALSKKHPNGELNIQPSNRKSKTATTITPRQLLFFEDEKTGNGKDEKRVTMDIKEEAAQKNNNPKSLAPNPNETPEKFKSAYSRTNSRGEIEIQPLTSTKLFCMEDEDTGIQKEDYQVTMNLQDDSFCSMLDSESSPHANIIPEHTIPFNERLETQQENPYHNKAHSNYTELYNQRDHSIYTDHNYLWQQYLPVNLVTPPQMVVAESNGQSFFNFNSVIPGNSTTGHNNSWQHHNFNSHPDPNVHLPDKPNLQEQYLHSCIAIALREYVAKMIIVDSGRSGNNHDPFIASAIIGASTAHIDKKHLSQLAMFWGMSLDEMRERATEHISSGAFQFEKLPENWFIRYAKTNGRPFYISYINSGGIMKKITSWTHPSSKSFSLEECTYEPCDTATKPQQGDFTDTSFITQQGLAKTNHYVATGSTTSSTVISHPRSTTTTGSSTGTATTITGTTSIDVSPSTNAPSSEYCAKPSTSPITPNTVDGAATNGTGPASLCSSKLDWCSAETLKNSLQGRTNLHREEIEVVRLLNLMLMTTDQSGVQSLVIPRGRGQTEDTIFYKKPPKRMERFRSCVVREIVPIVVALCTMSNITLLNVIIALAKEEKDKISIQFKNNPADKVNLILESIALIRIAGLSHNKYHSIRMFVERVWFIKLGAPLHDVKQYLKEKCPSSDCVSLVDSFQVGSTEANSDKKFKECYVWYEKRPCDRVGSNLSHLDSLGVLAPTSEITTLSDDCIVLSQNFDKGSDRTVAMVRIMNEENGNSGKSTMVMGVIGDNANESHYNLRKAFFHSDNHPIKFFFQNLVLDNLFAMRISLSDNTGRVCVIAWSVFCCLVKVQAQSFPHHSSILEKEIEDDQYLKSSEECLIIKRVEDFNNLCLLKHNRHQSYVALALLTDSGTILAWVTLGDEAINANEMLVYSVEWKQLKSWDDSDGKMISSLIGHQGCSSLYKCNCCIKVQSEINDFESRAPLREGELVPEKSYEKYINYGACTGKKDENARRDASLSIAHPPLLNIPVTKRMFEPCHTLSGCMEHIDKIIVKEIIENEKSSLEFANAESNRDFLCRRLQELKNERKARVKGVQRDRKNAIECQDIIDQNPNLEPNARIFSHLNDIVQSSKICDTALQELDEHITLIEEGLKHVTKYLSSELNFLSVLVLDYAYHSAANVSLGNYHGGRKMLFRDAMRVSVNFDSIASCCIDVMMTIIGDRDPIFLLKHQEALEKAKKCVAPLGKVFVMAESQKKIPPEKATLFQQYCTDFAVQVRAQYPSVPFWMKIHWLVEHLPEIPRLYGFCGRANAQGFEATHVIMNNIQDSSRGRKGSEQVMATFQQKLRSSKLSAVSKIERTFKSQGPKVANRKKVTKDPSLSVSVRTNCEVTSETQILFNRIFFSRCSITTCGICGKRYPTIIGKRLHAIANHTSICLEFLNEAID